MNVDCLISMKSADWRWISREDIEELRAEARPRGRRVEGSRRTNPRRAESASPPRPRRGKR